MDNSILSRLLTDIPFYSAHFMDLTIWEPSVRLVCERHKFNCRGVCPGIPGSFPTFIVELEADGTQDDFETIVVKFYGRLFEGRDSFVTERVMGHFLTQQSLPIRSPAILADGQLTPEWEYLVFEGVPGMSLGQVRQQLSQVSRMRVAGQMGDFIKELHAITAAPQHVIPMSPEAMSWEGFVTFLHTQRADCHANHQRWNDLPAQLVEQVQDYLLPVEDLIDLASSPHLIHADLTGDHLLGRLVKGKKLPALLTQSQQVAEVDWDSLAIIDWGDTRVGNVLYELVALHMDLFQVDKYLLRICLEHYGMPDFYQQDFPRRALCMVLLHQFPMPAQVYAPHRDVQTLPDLAERLFGG